jgi:hypothetical protein
VVTAQRGAGRLRRLLWLLFAVVVAYFAFNVGDAYVRYFRFRDAIRQEARFAARSTDGDIRSRLSTLAAGLGVPEEGTRVQVRRTPSRIFIWADYEERIELPFVSRTIRFHPLAEGDL